MCGLFEKWSKAVVWTLLDSTVAILKGKMKT